MAEIKINRERRRGSRAGRRSTKDTLAAVQKVPTSISRNIPHYDLLSEDSLQALDDHAEWILKEVGIEFRGDEECLRLFKEAGATVKGERVTFDSGHIRHLCSTAPEIVKQTSRNPERTVTMGGNETVFAPAYGPPFVRDLKNGRRYGNMEDLIKLIKIAYMTPYLHHSGGVICEPVDVAVNKRHLDMGYAHLKWSDKPFMGAVTAPERSADSIELARIATGRKRADEACIVMGNINCNSPLVYDDTMTMALRTYSAANQVMVIAPFILGGAMGPVTPAAAIAQAHAESMVGVALTQLVRPGAPVIYGNFLASMSLKSGAPTFGMPEPALAFMAVGQLARKLGVPLRCGGHFTSSKIADGQAMQEAADSMMPALMSGVNFVLHAAGWLEGGLTLGFEKFIMDIDRCGMMHRLFEGIALDDNALAKDAFLEAGPGNHYLGTAHTMANYQTAYYEPMVADPNSFEQWRDNGEKDTQQRAFEKWNAMLDTYEAPPLDPAIDEELQAYIAKRKESMPDAWY
jgi:trimethylamine--corrinoid protein Co-methyltransferase